MLETRARLTQHEFEARVRNDAVLQQLAVACRQVARICDHFNSLIVRAAITAPMNLLDYWCRWESWRRGR